MYQWKEVNAKRKNRDGQRSLMGRTWLSNLDFRVTEYAQNRLYNININQNHEPKKSQIFLKKLLKNLFKRQRKKKDTRQNPQSKEEAKQPLQKGWRVPLELQQKLQDETNNLLRELHIEKIDKLTDDVFMQPVLSTVKNDRSVKVALHARALNTSSKG